MITDLPIGDSYGFFKSISFILFPFLTNSSLLLFIIFSIDVFMPAQDRGNILGVVAIFIYYLGCLALFIAYGRSTNGLAELFGHATNTCIVIALMVSYPIFYLFWLPYLIYQLLVYAGTPALVWEKVFVNTSLSLENLYPEFSSNGCILFTRYIYIGIPFFIFALIYIVLIIFLTPLWYYILSPLGFGTFGICLHVSLHFPHSTETDLRQRMVRTYKWGVFIHVYALALPCILVSGLYLGLVGGHWQAILLMVTSALQFVVDVVPATISSCAKESVGDGGIYL